MTVRKTMSLVVLTLLGLAEASASARAGVYIGVGVPGPYYRGYYRPYCGPRVYVGLPPVVVAPAPATVVVTPVYAVPAVQAVPAPVYVAPPVATVPAPLPAAPVPVR
jgi:hypothetical protein